MAIIHGRFGTEENATSLSPIDEGGLEKGLGRGEGLLPLSANGPSVHKAWHQASSQVLKVGESVEIVAADDVPTGISVELNGFAQAKAIDP